MYKVPTSRRRGKKEAVKPNLIPILDAVFIFIFFLLMSANFVKIFEIQSDVPMISEVDPPKDLKDPLALTLKISETGFELLKGVPSIPIKSIAKLPDGSYNVVALHDYLLTIKKENKEEKTIIFEPIIDLSYEELVLIMDGVRMMANTDDDIFIKDKEGIDTKVKELFNNIVFGNIKS